MKTFMDNAQNVERKWYVVDAEGKTLGRLATQVAAILRGKHKPTYTPHIDNGDYVVIVNAEKIHLTGKKWSGKKYYKHSGHYSGLTVRTAQEVMDRFPTRMVEEAIQGMLPHNRLGRQIAKKLFVYAGPDHKHTAQQPEVLEVL